MKKIVLVLLGIFIFQFSVFSQKIDHSSIDEIDIKNIFKEQGINFFKDQFTLNKGEYIDVEIKVYEKGKLIKTYNQLNEVCKDLGIDLESGDKFNYQVSRKDTIAYHRFYFFKQNDTLKTVINVPGLSSSFKYCISKVKYSDVFQIPDIPKNLEGKTILGFYYGIFKDNSKDFLECPSGLGPDKLISTFDIVIMIFGEKKKDNLI
jgi:hypothetical protein